MKNESVVSLGLIVVAAGDFVSAAAAAAADCKKFSLQLLVMGRIYVGVDIYIHSQLFEDPFVRGFICTKVHCKNWH